MLTDFAQARYEALSFFLIVLLASVAVVQWLWNSLSRDFSKWPRMSYSRSLAAVALWGTLVLVVLTMIACTREIMTPGTWQKQGLLYQVPDTSEKKP
jgi:hypothetical protein